VSTDRSEAYQTIRSFISAQQALRTCRGEIPLVTEKKVEENTQMPRGEYARTYVGKTAPLREKFEGGKEKV